MWHKGNLVLVDGVDGFWHWGHTGWDWAMGFHGLYRFLLLALILIGAVLLVRRLARGGSAKQVPELSGVAGRETALATLDGRYARGEIDRRKYLERKRDLS